MAVHILNCSAKPVTPLKPGLPQHLRNWIKEAGIASPKSFRRCITFIVVVDSSLYVINAGLLILSNTATTKLGQTNSSGWLSRR